MTPPPGPGPDPRLDRLAELLRGLEPDQQDDALEWIEDEFHHQDQHDDQENEHGDNER